MKFADVCVNISREELDKPFSYIIPEEMEDSLKPGSRVLVPFGRRKMDGYVLGIRDSVDYPAELLKPILEIRLAQEDSAQKLIDVAAFLRRRYGSTMIAALKTVLPIKKTYRRKSAAAADEFVPLSRGSDGSITTQYIMTTLEELGLLKGVDLTATDVRVKAILSIMVL